MMPSTELMLSKGWEKRSVIEQENQVLIAGTGEIIDQGLLVLSSLSNEQYAFKPSQHMTSSIGEHFRHIIDLLLNLKYGCDEGFVDYDIRRRGSDIESDRDAAISQLSSFKVWLETADISSLSSVTSEGFTVKTEVSVSACKTLDLPSTFLRELAFVGMHMVHHLALVRVLASFQGLEIDQCLGVAPATATYRRDEACAP